VDHLDLEESADAARPTPRKFWLRTPTSRSSCFPEVAEHLQELRHPNTALFDNRARRFLGVAEAEQ